MVFFGGVMVGRQSNLVPYPQPPTEVHASLQVTLEAKNNPSRSSGEPSLDSRMAKYSRRYRYLPAAPRFDYNPYPAPICGKEIDFFDAFFKLDGKQRSRWNEDKFVYETFFKDRTTTMTGSAGTYVEIGAFNGIQESNTHFFDKCLGWEGLLVEGNPTNYQSVLENREFAHKMSFAPTCDGMDPNATVQFSRYPMTNAGLKGHAKTYDLKPMVDVPCGPFTPVLGDIFNGRPINFFSLDVEGAECLVLKTIDFQKIHIDVMMIEIRNNHCRTIHCEVRKLVRKKMKEEGYKRYQSLVEASDIYVHPNSTFQVKDVQPSK